ncbi:MAG: tetratricopeptide repeat protein [Bacteroidales bacterium]|nr:tetratricopeptide repeat protein [Bacteroidales bacterium]
MKRFFITLAVALMIVPTIGAQSQDGAKAVRNLAKAKEAVSKKNNADSWIKLGDAYAACYDAPINGLFLNNSQSQTNLLLKGAVRLASEQKEINGKTYTCDTYIDKEVYYRPDGALAGYKVIKPLTEDNALAGCLEAYDKAASLGAADKDLNPLYVALAKRHWDAAMVAYNLMNYADASNEFEQSYIINSKPAVGALDTNALIYAGIAAVLGKDSKRSISLFEKCMELNIADGDIIAMLADSYKAQGDTTKCKDILAKGFEKFPTNQGILVSLINTYLETNDDPEKIIVVLKKAQENEPTNASLVYAEGNLYKNMKQYDKCIELYRKAAELNPTYVFAPYNEGDTYYQMALDLQDKASAEPDDAKFNELNNQMNDCLKKAIEPFERAFSIAEDPEIKRGCAEYLKQIYFRFRDEKPEYQANYDKYHKFLTEPAAPAN